jgi:hypothetical protein
MNRRSVMQCLAALPFFGWCRPRTRADSSEWYRAPAGVVYNWRHGGSTTDPDGRVVWGADKHRIRFNGDLVPSRIFELKAGPRGYVTFYVKDKEGRVHLNANRTVVSRTHYGNVEYSYRHPRRVS